MTEPLTEGQQEAHRRLTIALELGEAKLSDVIYDAHDYNEHGYPISHGYDPDDLATVLLPLLKS